MNQELQTVNNYAWKLASLAKGIDVQDAVTELDRIKSIYGSLTPENVLNASRLETAVLYKLFNWDDAKAAEHYRLQQARTILNNIEVKVISNGQPKQIAVYEVIRDKSTQEYKSIQSMTSTDITFIKQRTKQELTILKDKLSVYKELSDVTTALSVAIEALN
jgi:hypothetical protein